MTIGVEIEGVQDTIRELKEWNFVDGDHKIEKAIKSIAVESAAVLLRQIAKDLTGPMDGQKGGIHIDLRSTPKIIFDILGDTLTLKVDIIKIFRKELKPNRWASHEAPELKKAADYFREIADLCEYAAKRIED